MNFTVTLTPVAEANLADLWLAASDRAEVTWAADVIERELRRFPNVVGEVLFDTVRQIRIDPLIADFEIVAEDLRVQILRFNWAS